MPFVNINGLPGQNIQNCLYFQNKNTQVTGPGVVGLIGVKSVDSSNPNFYPIIEVWRNEDSTTDTFGARSVLINGDSTGDNNELTSFGALLELQGPGGLLLSRLMSSEITEINNPQPGMMVYCTDSDVNGFYFYTENGWCLVLTNSAGISGESTPGDLIIFGNNPSEIKDSGVNLSQVQP